MDNVAIKFLAELAVALSDVLPSAAQIEHCHEKLPPRGGVLGVRPYIALPEWRGLEGVVHTRAPEGSDQTATPGPNPTEAVSLSHQTIDFAKRCTAVAKVEKDVGAPAGDRRDPALLLIREDDLVEMTQGVLVFAQADIVGAQRVVDLRKVGIQP